MSTDLQTLFSQHIHRQIGRKGLLMKDIAKKAGVCENTIGRFLSGKAGIYLDRAGRILEAAGLGLIVFPYDQQGYPPNVLCPAILEFLREVARSSAGGISSSDAIRLQRDALILLRSLEAALEAERRVK